MSENENTEIEVPLESAAETALVEETAAEEAAALKRRIRTGTLFATAVVLGVLGGVGTGYGIQSSRPETPLPPLAGSRPAYAPAGVYRGVVPAMLPASQDDATVADGDLTKLLLPVPAGASTADSPFVDQMMDIGSASLYCQDELSCFKRDYEDGITAIADTVWTTRDGYTEEIRIDRFAPGNSGTARDWASTNTSYGSPSISTPTGMLAGGYEFVDKYGDNTDYAIAAHGDLAVEFWVDSPAKTPDPSLIDGLMTQQMGRL